MSDLARVILSLIYLTKTQEEIYEALYNKLKRNG